MNPRNHGMIVATLLAVAPSVNAQTVNWTKSLDYNVASDTSISIIGATSGSTIGQTVSGVVVGKGAAWTSTPGTSVDPDHFGVFTDNDHYFEYSLTFDQMLSGGALLNVGSFDWSTVWEITISGGNGVLQNIGVQPLESGSSKISSLGSISGDGTDTLVFAVSGNENNNSVSFDDYYNGGTGISITGTWNKVTLRASNPTIENSIYSGASYDNIAGFVVNGATVVPEPTSLGLCGAGLAILVVRRRRL